MIAPAAPAQLAPLAAAAYGLSRRERELAAQLLRGLSTGEIARRLWLSPHTVQDHVKSIDDKTGAHSRADLVARVFYDQAQPQLDAGSEPAANGWFAP